MKLNLMMIESGMCGGLFVCCTYFHPLILMFIVLVPI